MRKPKPRIRLERPSARRERDYLNGALRSRALHRGYVVPSSTPREYRTYLRATRRANQESFFVVDAVSNELAGVININNIVQGAFLSGALGYGAFAHAAGRGLMREGLDLVVGYAFGPLRLHRLEINVQPGNTASIALARSCGFRLEGFSPGMLYIDGAWRDHQRWAVTAEMRASG